MNRVILLFILTIILTNQAFADSSIERDTRVVSDTEANILTRTVFSGRMARATNLDQLMISTGTAWEVSSAYFDANLSAPDMGWIQGSNRAGYGRDYITDKRIS